MQGIERTPVRSSDDADAKSSTRADLGDGASKAQVALEEILWCVECRKRSLFFAE